MSIYNVGVLHLHVGIPCYKYRLQKQYLKVSLWIYIYFWKKKTISVSIWVYFLKYRLYLKHCSIFVSFTILKFSQYRVYTSCVVVIIYCKPLIYVYYTNGDAITNSRNLYLPKCHERSLTNTPYDCFSRRTCII